MTMRHDPRIPLADIERAAEKIAGNLMHQRAVERCFGFLAKP